MPCFASSFLSGWRLAKLCARRGSETSATPVATTQCSARSLLWRLIRQEVLRLCDQLAERREKTPFVVCGHSDVLSWLGGSWFNKGRALPGFVDLEGALAHVGSGCGASSASFHWQPLPSNVGNNKVVGRL